MKPMFFIQKVKYTSALTLIDSKNWTNPFPSYIMKRLRMLVSCSSIANFVSNFW